METITSSSDDQAVKEYAEFLRRVERTVFLDNLAPSITPSIITKGLNQFGDVIKVELIPNYAIPFPIPGCALVEMKTPKQAEAVIAETFNLPFIMFGMPRPARAVAAKLEMFADRPSVPDTQITVRWVEKSDPDFEVGRQMRQLCKKHAAETFELIKQSIAEEEKLSKQQSEMLDPFYKKYELMDELKKNGFIARIARFYGIKVEDDF